MKVGIFTFPNSKSFGASLQMYAIFRAVQKLGHDVEIINYQNKYMKSEKHIVSKSTSKRIRRFISNIFHFPQKRAFHTFEKIYLCKYPSRILSDSKKLQIISKRYNAVICGSDQIWNPNITGNDINYFLRFCGESTKRIAYAPSFGVDEVTDDFGTAIREELTKFSALSVREKEGSELVKRLIGKDINVVLDPTFLIEANEWQSIEKQHPIVKDGEYILYYTIRSSENLWNRCKILSAKTGLKIIRVGGNAIKRITNKEPMIDYASNLSPSEWLSLVHHARYVVTNSFHGSVFSIIYHKNFYVEFSSLTNSRLKQITELSGLEDRIINEGVEITPSNIDYNRVDERLNDIKKTSANYLKAALDEAINYG